MSLFIRLHHLIRRLQQRNKIVGRSTETGLSITESHFLIELDAAPNSGISELSAILMLDQGFVSRIAASLVTLGVISISKDPTDKRKRILRITPHGKRAVVAIDSSANAHYRAMAKDLTAGEERALVGLFKAIGDGSGALPATIRKSEPVYRAEQRRMTRSCGLLGDSVFGSAVSASQWQVLYEITLAPLPPQPGELALTLSLAQNSLSSLITSLETRNLVSRSGVGRDGRRVVLRPTAAGKDLCNRIEAAASTWLGHALRAAKKSRILEDGISAFSKFINDTGEGYPALLPHLVIHEALSRDARAEARGLVARCMVREGREQELPEQIVPSQRKCAVLLEDKHVVGVLDIDPKTGEICTCGWEPHISHWLFSAFVGAAYKQVLPTRSLPGVDVLRTFLGVGGEG